MSRKKTALFRTWVEIDTDLLRRNLFQLRKLIGPQRRFMAVVKSNAYGHGLVGVARALISYRLAAAKLWFGVDSIVEALRLREEGIRNPVLVFGSTLTERMHEAADNDITLTISNFDALASLSRLPEKPTFHLKIDTGMHRQGFAPEDVVRLVKYLRRFRLSPAGIYTHFAAAKDRAYPTITRLQLKSFQDSVEELKHGGFKNILKHAAASGGAILFPETRLDMVRVGMALWGHWPSEEARLNVVSGMFGLPNLPLRPILSWKTKIAETKELPAGASVGYDLTERITRKSVIAVLPVGYWHGFDRGLSSVGSVLVRGKRAKILGRISMDMTLCDVTDIAGARVGDIVTLIGRHGREEVAAEEIARLIGTTAYEVLTRINPLIERVYK